MGNTNAEGYASAVVSVLVTEFSALAEPDTASLVRKVIAQHVAVPTSSFEVILDSPTLANWRLRAHREHPSRVRLACHRLEQTSTDLDQEQRVNAALDRISRSPGRT